MIPPETKAILEHQQYRLVGDHSAVKICHWTKKSLLDEGVCYKERFYGIECHRCLQMTPAVSWCTQKCIFCWRNTEQTLGCSMDKVDEPKNIIEDMITAQRKLLSGFGGNPDKVNQKKFKEAQDPNQVAISLSGEPTIYPRLSELIEEFKKREFSVFLVTNGTLPERLESLEHLPSQLYVSLDAPDERTYDSVCKPMIPDGWERLNRTLEIFPTLKTRTVTRITLVKNRNIHDAEGYAKLIGKAEPDYIEVKAFMFVGGSRLRLSMDNMPSFEEVYSFSEKLAEHTGYNIKDEKIDSRVVLLSKK